MGVDKNGEEFFQITIGGSQGKESAIGKVLGRAFRAEEVPGAIDRLLSVYLSYREVEERFVDTVRRIGLAPFKEGVYQQEAIKPEVSA